MKYLVPVGKRAEVEPYLGFSAKMIESGQGPTRAACIVTVDDRDAKWQAGRFSSGLFGGWTFDTLEAAREEYQWWLAR